jgi:hypothetical protein
MAELHEAEFRALLDRAQIHDALMRYSRGVDRGDGELVVACFHPDATLDYGRGPGRVGLRSKDDPVYTFGNGG